MLKEILMYYEVEEAEEKKKTIEEYLNVLKCKRKWAGLSSKKLSEEPENVVVDTLGILSVLDSKKRKDVVDIGSGAGIVGVVISIVCTDWNVVMAESSERKATFLAETIGLLRLGNATVERERAEKLSSRLMFNAAVGRAAGSLGKIVPIALGLLKPGGLYVGIKGSVVEAETRNAKDSIESSGGELVGIKKPSYPGELGIPDRVSLVVIRKI